MKKEKKTINNVLRDDQERTLLISFTEAKKLKMEEETNKIIAN